MRIFRHNVIFAVLLLLLPLLVPSSGASTVAIGDHRDAVMDAMGKPSAVISSPPREVLYYERGKIVIEEDRVTAVDLISVDEAEKERIQRQEAADYHRQMTGQLGETIRDRKRSDPAFISRPAEEQLAYWQRFKQSYPSVHIDLDYTMSLQRLVRQQTEAVKEAAEERRIAELEARVREAEARARSAEEKARQSQPPVNVVINNNITTTSAPSSDDGYSHSHGAGYYYVSHRRPYQRVVTHRKPVHATPSTTCSENLRPRNTKMSIQRYRVVPNQNRWLLGKPGSQTRSVFKPPLYDSPTCR